MNEDTAVTVSALLRLLQVSDSAFPVGGYAYSHGLEWLTHEGRLAGAEDVASVLHAFIAQPLRCQVLPAAVRAFRARTGAQVVRIDHSLDASLIAESEREAGRAMGARLLETASDSQPDPVVASHLVAVRSGEAPGQYAVAFALVARATDSGEETALAALGYASCASLVSAAVRLGVIGQSAAARITASAATPLTAAVGAVRSQRRPSIGSFAPQLELATLLQPTLQFRMFAS